MIFHQLIFPQKASKCRKNGQKISKRQAKKKGPTSQVETPSGVYAAHTPMQKNPKGNKSQSTNAEEAEKPEVEALEQNTEATSDEAQKKKKRPRAEGSKGVKSKKRGPPRPHKKLAQEVLHSRITKLQKRIDRARGQLEDAERHIDSYNKEAKYRLEDEKNDQSGGIDD